MENSKKIHEIFAKQFKKRLLLNKIPPDFSSRGREFSCIWAYFCSFRVHFIGNCRHCDAQTAFSCRFSTRPSSNPPSAIRSRPSFVESAGVFLFSQVLDLFLQGAQVVKQFRPTWRTCEKHALHGTIIFFQALEIL